MLQSCLLFSSFPPWFPFQATKIDFLASENVDEEGEILFWAFLQEQISKRIILRLYISVVRFQFYDICLSIILYHLLYDELSE